MLPALLATETVTRLRAPAATDAHGNAVNDWDAAGEFDIEGCSVQPLDGPEFVLGRDSVTSRWVLFAPLDADMLSSDRIRHDGVEYEVDGSVQKWPDVGGLGHKFAYLKKVEG